MDAKPDDTMLPCGCYWTFSDTDGVRMMQIAPCREGCPFLAMALEMASERKVLVVEKEGP